MGNRKFGSRGGMAAPGRMRASGQIFLFRTPVYTNNLSHPKSECQHWSGLVSCQNASHVRGYRGIIPPPSFTPPISLGHLINPHVRGGEGGRECLGGVVEIVEGLSMRGRGETGMGSMWVMMWLVCPSLLVLVTRGGL